MSNPNQRTTMDNAQSFRNEAEKNINSATSAIKNEASNLQDGFVKSASDIANNVSSKLKSVGVDTDVIVDATQKTATDLQKMLVDEIKARPLRSLGIAAAIGVVFGMMQMRG